MERAVTCPTHKAKESYLLALWAFAAFHCYTHNLQYLLVGMCVCVYVAWMLHANCVSKLLLVSRQRMFEAIRAFGICRKLVNRNEMNSPSKRVRADIVRCEFAYLYFGMFILRKFRIFWQIAKLQTEIVGCYFSVWVLLFFWMYM